MQLPFEQGVCLHHISIPIVRLGIKKAAGVCVKGVVAITAGKKEHHGHTKQKDAEQQIKSSVFPPKKSVLMHTVPLLSFLYSPYHSFAILATGIRLSYYVFRGWFGWNSVYPDVGYCDIAQREKREFVLVYKPVKTGRKPAKFLDRMGLFRYIEIA